MYIIYRYLNNNDALTVNELCRCMKESYTVRVDVCESTQDDTGNLISAVDTNTAAAAASIPTSTMSSHSHSITTSASTVSTYHTRYDYTISDNDVSMDDLVIHDVDGDIDITEDVIDVIRDDMDPAANEGNKARVTKKHKKRYALYMCQVHRTYGP